MNTEITDNDGGRSWIFYDGQCSLCRAWAARLQAIPALRTFGFLPLQTPWVRERLRLDDATLLTEMRVLLPDGRVWGGAEAVVEVGWQHGRRNCHKKSPKDTKRKPMPLGHGLHRLHGSEAPDWLHRR